MKYKKNILSLVDEYQYKEAITYPKTNERIYGNFKIAAILAYIYQFIFIALFLWSSIYTASLSVYHFKEKNIFSAINAILLVIASGLLCITYIAR